MKAKNKSKPAAKKEDPTRFPMTNAELHGLVGYLVNEDEGKPV